MTKADRDVLVGGLTPVVRDLAAAAVASLQNQINALRFEFHETGSIEEERARAFAEQDG